MSDTNKWSPIHCPTCTPKIKSPTAGLNLFPIIYFFTLDRHAVATVCQKEPALLVTSSILYLALHQIISQWPTTCTAYHLFAVMIYTPLVSAPQKHRQNDRQTVCGRAYIFMLCKPIINCVSDKTGRVDMFGPVFTCLVCNLCNCHGPPSQRTHLDCWRTYCVWSWYHTLPSPVLILALSFLWSVLWYWSSRDQPVSSHVLPLS